VITTATDVKRMELVDATSIPDGTYAGDWGGYLVRFTAKGARYEAKTKDGIRTLNAPCAVIVSGGKIEVRVK